MADDITITQGSGTKVATDDDGTRHHQYVKLEFGADNTQTKVSSSDPLPVIASSNSGVDIGDVTINNAAGASAVNIQDGGNSITVDGTLTGITNTINVQLDPGHTLGNIGTITTLTGITNTVHVDFQGSNPSVQANLIVGQTGVAAGSGVTGVTTQRVVLATDSVGSMVINSGSITPVVAFNSGVTGATTQRFVHATDVAASVSIVSAPAFALNSGVTGATTQRVVQAVDSISSISISSAPAFALNSGVTGATTQRVVHAVDVATSINIVSQGLAALNMGGTASLFTASGTVTSAGNNTIISPSASYSFKVYAYSIQTTGISSIAPRFTTGASAGATELWRPLITPVDTGAFAKGANLVSAPNAPLFVTGTSTTLSLYLDAGSLIHYSVAYVKESA